MLLHIVEMRGMALNVITSIDPLEKQERIEVWVLPRGSIVENADIGIHHFIITDEQEPRVVYRALCVAPKLCALAGQVLEVALSEINKLLVRHCACTHNDHVLSEVVRLMEIYDHVTVDLVDVVDVAEDRLAHHVLTVDVVVHILHQSLHLVFVCRLKLLPDCVLFKFHSVVVVV